MHEVSLEALRVRALDTAPPPRWRSEGFDVIAEIKLRAPSAGALGALDEDGIARRAATYAASGASAVSILTEPDRFDGSLHHLAAGASGLAIPAMRKDFLVHPYQVWEARLAGAGGVLLIATMLDDATLSAMMGAAAEADLFALVECFDERDLVRTKALLADAPEGTWLVGVNTRNLQTLEVVPDRLARLAAHLPDGVQAVAESGMSSPADVATAAELGYRAALVGTALMREADPGPLLRAMKAAGAAA